MYVPGKYRCDDPELIAEVIDAFSFATLISVVNHEPLMTRAVIDRIPETEPIQLFTHVAAANPHANILSNQSPIWIRIDGPHSYISPDWYSVKDVPTWDYITIELKGTVTILNDTNSVMTHMRRMTKRFEGESGAGFTYEQLKDGLIDAYQPHIKAVSVEVVSLDAAFKLSQNKPDPDKQRIADKLRAIGGDEREKIASWIDRFRHR